LGGAIDVPVRLCIPDSQTGVITRVHADDGKYRLDAARSRLQISSRRTSGPAERRARTMLHLFLESKRAEIIARTKAKVAARAVPRATEAELTHGIPLFFDQLIDTLKSSTLHS